MKNCRSCRVSIYGLCASHGGPIVLRCCRNHAHSGHTACCVFNAKTKLLERNKNEINAKQVRERIGEKLFKG